MAVSRETISLSDNSAILFFRRLLSALIIWSTESNSTHQTLPRVIPDLSAWIKQGQKRHYTIRRLPARVQYRQPLFYTRQYLQHFHFALFPVNIRYVQPWFTLLILKDWNLVRQNVHCFTVKTLGVFVDYFNVSRFRPLYQFFVGRNRKKVYNCPTRWYFGRHVNGQPPIGRYLYCLCKTHNGNIA